MNTTTSQRFLKINPWHFLWFSIISSEIFTAIINAALSVILWGKISRELVLIGTIDAFIVSLIVSTIVIYSVNKIRQTKLINERLQQEITERRKIEEELRRAHDELELRVEERTMELSQLNKSLAGQIEERQRAEEALQKAHDELENRVRERTTELHQANLQLRNEIRERKLLEEERRRLEMKALSHAKLASLGEIATGIAHEINQPLSYIRIVYESIMEDLGRGQLNLDELAEDSREALLQVNRIIFIIRHLQTFGHDDVLSFEDLDLPTILDNSLLLMSEILKRNNISLKRSIPASLPAIYGNAGKLEQVFINIFQNSNDVLKICGGGVIEVKMRQDQGKIIVEFQDNGPGIPVRMQEKIFEPFFTTKETGKGIGLGLSIVYGIINEHNGTIECKSEPGSWTKFVMALPIKSEKDTVL